MHKVQRIRQQDSRSVLANDISCRAREEALEEGREEGIKQGKTAMIKILLENYEPTKVAEMLKLSIDQVQAVIEE